MSGCQLQPGIAVIKSEPIVEASFTITVTLPMGSDFTFMTHGSMAGGPVEHRVSNEGHGDRALGVPLAVVVGIVVGAIVI